MFKLKAMLTAFLAVAGFCGFAVALVVGNPENTKNFWPVTLFFGVLAACAVGIVGLWVRSPQEEE